MDARKGVAAKPTIDFHGIDEKLIQKMVYGALVWCSLHGLVVGDKTVQRVHGDRCECLWLAVWLPGKLRLKNKGRRGGLVVDMMVEAFQWFARSGWKRTKDDIILELKSAYAINKLRKSGYSKNKFYTEAAQLYKEINTMIANGDKTSVRKAVTENMFSEIKNEIRIRESMWNRIYWEMVEPVVKIRTLRARLIAVDPKDMNKVFIQLTLEFLTKQKFEAYDSKGAVVAGDKTKEVLVREIWVFEKSLFHSNSYWRLCGRIKI
ncbi:hypothetical protein SLA2020_399010 [Shorea laevis]